MKLGLNTILSLSPHSGSKLSLAALCLLGLGFSAGPLRSATVTVTGVSIEDVSTELGGNFDRLAQYVIDGSGFDESTGFHSVVPDAFMWLNNGTFTAPNDPNAPGAVITFDLGANYDLDSVTVWNYNETLPNRPELLGRGANSVDIMVANSEGGVFTALGNFTFDIAPGAEDVDFGQVIDLSGFAAADDARLVRFNVLSNHGGDNDFVGLSEVRFDAIPEPGSALLVGLALCALTRRRSRS